MLLSTQGNWPRLEFARHAESVSSPGGHLMRLPGLEKVWAEGLTGKGQCIAIIDSGLFAHEDYADRVVG